MKPAPDLTPIEDLDRSILALCTRINAATYELLVMIREFDERAGFVKWGLENCAEWLAWRCDLAMTTAREKVRVAHALKHLPLVSSAFSTGELRCGNETSIGTAQRAWVNRSLRVRRDHERNMMTITVDLPLDTGELLDKALDKARDDECLAVPDLVDTSWSVRQADAFLTMVNEYLLSNAGNGHSNDNYLVTVHVDQSALAGDGGRSALPIESVKRLCCDSHVVVITEDDQGEPLNIGRTLVHEGGFSVVKDFLDNWAFVRPDGIAVPVVGYVSRMDEYPPAGGLLSAAERNVLEPAPPAYLH